MFYFQKEPELYNLAEGPGEKHNLADKNPTKLNELKSKLDAHLKETNALMPIPNPTAKKNFTKW